MSSQAKFIPFPLYLLSGLPENLKYIIAYGIFNFSRNINYDLKSVYTQVMYVLYRGELPLNLKQKIDLLVDNQQLNLDHDYNGFNDDEFSPESEVEELMIAGQDDSNFEQSCIEFHQVRQAFKLLGKTGNIANTIKAAKKIEKEIAERAIIYGADASVMCNIDIALSYLNDDKNSFEIDLFRGYLAIKSILGSRDIIWTTKKIVVRRMIGAKDERVEAELLKFPELKAIYKKYLIRYHIDRLFDQLVSRNFIKGKFGAKKMMFFSNKYSTSEMAEPAKELLLRFNSRDKRNAQKQSERKTREKLRLLLNDAGKK